MIDFHGKLTPEAGKYEGLDVFAARKQILEDLEAQGLLLETKEHLHSVGRCYRCNTIIEPLMSEQWFLKVQEMSQKAIKVVDDGKIKFVPSSWANPYKLWLENLRDWCISRQIWWGHRIPVYYCLSGKNCKAIASIEPIRECPHCGCKEIKQDEDVLDTWFSSALWPFSVFGWPSKESKDDLNYYYPTSVLVTGHEILYLWVARMIQMGLEFMKDIPFERVFIHGIVRDRFGKKMSKSLGNVIDPLEVMAKFGTDALRFAVTAAAAPGRDMQLSDDSFLSARNFCNKIWNASRFIFMNAQDKNLSFDKTLKADELADVWIISEYNSLIADVTNACENYNMDAAARLLYEFFWFKYCDWYIEIAKIRLNGQNETEKNRVLHILMEILSGYLRLLHPIMPFITEEVWQNLINFMPEYSQFKSIMKSQWPKTDKKWVNEAAVEGMRIVQEIVTAIRAIRSEMNIAPGKNISVLMNVSTPSRRTAIERNISYIKSLAKIENIEFGENIKRLPKSVSAVAGGAEIFVELGGLIDFEKEKTRLQKELAATNIELERCNQKLSNEDFAKHAPEKEVAKIKERQKEAQLKISKLNDSLRYLE